VSFSPLTLLVTDDDLPPNNGPFRYQILSGNDEGKFTVSDEGQLLAKGIFNMKVQNEYQLRVRIQSLFPSLHSLLIDQIAH